MSRSALRGIIAVCIVGALLIGITVLPRLWGEQTAHQVAREAVGPALQQSVRQVADEAGRRAAREMAEKILPDAHGSGAATVPTSSAASEPTPVAAPIKVERQAFEITLPSGATVDPEDASVGSERLVMVNMPDHGLLSIVVFDDKKRAESGFEETLSKLRGKMEKAEEEKPEALEALHAVRATGMKGTVKGEEFEYEIGQCEGWDKGFVMVLEYPEENKAAAVAMLSKALGTFRMKQ